MTPFDKNKLALQLRNTAVAMFSSAVFCQQALATGQYETDVKIDPVFGLPVPPVNWDGGGIGQYDPAVSGVATWIYVAIFSCALIWGLWETAKTKSTIPLFLSLSGIPCVFAELFLDVMGGVVYANSQDSVVFSLMGRHMGWFVISAWSAYGGLFALASYKVFSKPHLMTSAFGAQTLAALHLPTTQGFPTRCPAVNRRRAD